MLESLRNTTQGGLLRSIAIVASGTAGSQAITMAFTPLITRLYGPEAFGLAGAFMALLSVLAPVAALSYPMAIALPEKDQDARGLAKLSLWLALGLFVLLELLLLGYRDAIGRLIGWEYGNEVFLLLPLAMLFGALAAIVQQWMLRKGEFGAVAKTTTASSAVVNLGKTGLGLLAPSGIFLVLMTTLGQLLSALMMLTLSASTSLKSLFQAPTATLGSLARRHRDFPLFRCPQIAINAVSRSIAVLALAAAFGVESSGFYALATMILTAPINLIGKSVMDVFYPKVAECDRQGTPILPMLLATIKSLATFAVLPFLVIIVWGDVLFELVFGQEWGQAGRYASLMAPWLFVVLLNRPCIATIPILRAQHLFLAYEILSVAIRLLALFVGCSLFQDDAIAVGLFALASLLLNLALMLGVVIRCRSGSP